MSFARKALVAVSCGIVMLGVAPYVTRSNAADNFIFRYKYDAASAANETNPGFSIVVTPPSEGLTVGEEISLPVIPTGDPGDVEYQKPVDANMPGLTVDPVTGTVSGTPSAPDGTEIEIAVEAVRDGEIVARTPTMRRTVRAELQIDTVPDNIEISEGDPLPATGMAASASGGDQSTIKWSLSEAPTWLSVKTGSPPSGASLEIASGAKSQKTETTVVTITAKDGENRQSSETFQVTVKASANYVELSGSVWDFGVSVAMSADGNTLLVGNDWLDSGAGEVTVFEKSGSTWNKVQSFSNSDSEEYDEFGYRLALSADGNTALVAAYVHDDDRGAVYVFEKDGGVFSQKQIIAMPSSNPADDFFGWSVALSPSGNTAVVGSYSVDKGLGSLQGSAWVYTRAASNFALAQELSVPEAEGSYQFGFGVAASDNRILVGSPGANYKQGRAYVFSGSGGAWGLTATLAPSGSDGNFGRNVALSADGSTALVNSYNGSSASSAYVFSESAGWGLEAQLTIPGSTAGAKSFGYNIALSGDGDTVLAAIDPRNTTDERVYMFQRAGTSWNRADDLVAEPSGSGGGMGDWLALSYDGSTAAVGASWRGNGGTALVYQTR